MSPEQEPSADYQRLFELALDLLCTANFEGWFVALSPSWEAALGWTREELRSRPFLDFVHPEDVARTLKELDALGDGGVTVSFENRYRARDGRWRWLEWNAQPAPEEGIVYAVARDITARKEVERLRREFVSTVSHELRTPLTSVRGALGLLESGVLGTVEAEASELLQIARVSTDRLIRLINDLLDLEKIEAGAAPLVRRSLSLSALARRAFAELGPAAGGRVRFEARLADDLVVYADPDRLMQVLVNLLGNALRFSPDGGSIEVEAEPEEGGVLIRVRDHGPGVPEELLPTLFERFTQARPDAEPGVGSGLGLAICRAIVEQHGGWIAAGNAQDGGAVCSIHLPSAPAPAPELPLPVSDGRWELLVVEDDPSLARTVAEILRRDGWGVRVAATVQEAREALAQKVPRLLLLDLELRGESGLEVWEALRAEARTAAVPVLLTSGHDPERELLRLPLVRDWLKKPFDSERFLSAVRRVVGASSEG